MRCRAWEPPSVVRGGGPSVGAALVAAKRAVRGSVARLVPEPEASFLMGLLAGERGGIPPDMLDSFRASGTAHILAVSGYNVSRVVEAAVVAFAVLGLRRRRAAVFAAALVAAFAAAVGAEPSVVRAAVMGCVGLLADLMGRRYSGPIALVGAAAAMLAANPFVLRHDLGFALSFSAVMGLQALAPPLAARMRWLPEALGIRRTLAETLAATAATLPLVIRAFGAAPIASPLANILILPFIPAAMGLGAAAAALGAVWPPLGAPAAFAAAALLRGIAVASDASGSLLPPVPMTLGPAGVFASYCVLAAAWWAAGPRDRLRA
jgi:competence protein ComEC